jgi:hypothetical protein
MNIQISKKGKCLENLYVRRGWKKWRVMTLVISNGTMPSTRIIVCQSLLL